MFLIRLKQSFPVAKDPILHNGQEDFKKLFLTSHCPVVLNLGFFFSFVDSSPSRPVKKV